MTARCYPCDVHAGVIPGAVARGDPHGVCGICSVMACCGHGVREPNRPRFECVMCIPALLIASAAVTASRPSTLGDRLRTLIEDLGGDQALIRDLDDFTRRYPAFAGWIDDLPSMRENAGRRYITAETEPFFWSLPEVGRDFLLLSVLVVLRLELRDTGVGDVLYRLVRPWW